MAVFRPSVRSHEIYWECHMLADLQKKNQILEATIENLEAELERFRLDEKLRPITSPDPVGGNFYLWSTYRFMQGDVLSYTEVKLFTTPLGMAGQGTTSELTYTDTNLKEGGRLGGPGVQVRGLVVDFLGGSSQDIMGLRETGVLSWNFHQIRVDQAPLGALSWDTAGRRGILRLGSPEDYEIPSAQGNLIRFTNQGVYLPSSTSFALLLRCGRKDRALDQSMAVRVTLVSEVGWELG